jgi:hypothetical protein
MIHIINKDETKTQSKMNNDLFGLFADSDDFYLTSKKSYSKIKAEEEI